MQVQKIKNSIAVHFALAVVISQLVSCADCEEAISYNVLPREGNVLIDTIYSKWGDHASTAASKTGNKLLFNAVDFVVVPKVGDSLVKRKSEAEYTLYTKDSVYVQRFDCRKSKAIIISQTKRE